MRSCLIFYSFDPGGRRSCGRAPTFGCLSRAPGCGISILRRQYGGRGLGYNWVHEYADCRTGRRAIREDSSRCAREPVRAFDRCRARGSEKRACRAHSTQRSSRQSRASNGRGNDQRGRALPDTPEGGGDDSGSRGAGGGNLAPDHTSRSGACLPQYRRLDDGVGVVQYQYARSGGFRYSARTDSLDNHQTMQGSIS